MKLPYHFRALDSNGCTIRQSTEAFPTVEAAQTAADKATRITGETHVVCTSLDPKDPRNSQDPLKAGWMVHAPGESAGATDATGEATVSQPAKPSRRKVK